ncbi:hypothetical protein F5050DRAFT_136828 [Lentinula boryana]|uniref:Secreted protein n=1 Tax=Lentinula boryana TaxID=40481 RepID=A0ABQ8QCM6_9AGAR|nr:hypothetical protein F5050DRAFT_136828 [Lentinula boryana]
MFLRFRQALLSLLLGSSKLRSKSIPSSPCKCSVKPIFESFCHSEHIRASPGSKDALSADTQFMREYRPPARASSGVEAHRDSRLT